MMFVVSSMSRSLTSLRSSLSVLCETHASLAAPSRLLHSSRAASSWGSGKLKTHQGTAKRFKPTGKRYVVDSKAHPSRRIPTILEAQSELDSLPQDVGVPAPSLHLSPIDRKALMAATLASLPVRQIGTMFKRGHAGKRHLNSKMSSQRSMRLRQNRIHESGPTIKVLNRLLGNHY